MSVGSQQINLSSHRINHRSTKFHMNTIFKGSPFKKKDKNKSNSKPSSKQSSNQQLQATNQPPPPINTKQYSNIPSQSASSVTLSRI